MIYTLTLFDIIPDKIQLYRQYSKEVGKLIPNVGAMVVCSGWHRKTLRGEEARHFFIVVEFPTEEALDYFLNAPAHRHIHDLREQSTTNYMWKVLSLGTLYAG